MPRIILLGIILRNVKRKKKATIKFQQTSFLNTQLLLDFLQVYFRITKAQMIYDPITLGTNSIILCSVREWESFVSSSYLFKILVSFFHQPSNMLLKATQPLLKVSKNSLSSSCDALMMVLCYARIFDTSCSLLRTVSHLY